MWSIGVILYILLVGYPPFHSTNRRLLNSKVKEGKYEFDAKYWSHVSENAKDLIRKLLAVDPRLRITADQALRHPWIVEKPHVLSSISLSTSFKNMKNLTEGAGDRRTV